MSEANEFPVISRIICLHTRKTNYNEFALVIICFIVINKIRLLSIGKYFPLGPDIVITNMYFSQCSDHEFLFKQVTFLLKPDFRAPHNLCSFLPYNLSVASVSFIQVKVKNK